jgi:hypothetical protein
MVQQVKNVTSEALEAAYRALTPSQDGFTEDLMASNTIIPVLDLSGAAAGAVSPLYQQQALAFGSMTSFNIQNTTTVLANTSGFWLFYGVSDVRSAASGTTSNVFNVTDGLSVKQIWKHEVEPVTTDNHSSIIYQFVIFLRSGDSVSGISDSTRSNLTGSYRQLADVNGDIVYPIGFTPQ